MRKKSRNAISFILLFAFSTVQAVIFSFHTLYCQDVFILPIAHDIVRQKLNQLVYTFNMASIAYLLFEL